MADRIKGITIEIDGNTTKLSKALEGVNKDIKDTQTQLKDVDKLLKLDPGNIDLLKQKEELLNTAVGETKEKLTTLKDALAQMDASGVDKTSAEYQALQREIISTESELDKLESASNKANATMQKIATTAESVATGAKKVASATSGLSTAAGGALTALAGLAISSATNADDLNTLAKQTGLSTDALQKMSYASDLVDVSVDDITGAVKKMKSKLEDSEDTFTAIGVSIKDSNGEYRNTEDIFYDVVEALGNIDNETERDTVAMDIFGKSADSLAGILDDGGASLQELGQEAEDKGLIISQEDLDNANALNDKIDTLKADLSGSFGQAAVSALEAFTPLIETVCGWLEKAATWISTLSPQTLEIVAIVLAVIAAISPIASIISGIATVLSVVIPIIAAVNAVIAANPVVLIVMAIVAAIAALIAIGVLLYKNWDEIKAKCAELLAAVKAKFEAIKTAISEKLNAVKEKVATVFTNIKQTIVDKVTEIKDKALTWGKDIIDNLVQGIKDKISAVTDAVSEIGQKIKDFLGFSEPKKGPLSKFHTFMPDMIDLMTKGIDENLNKVDTTMSNLATHLVPDRNINVNYNDSNVAGLLGQLNTNVANRNTTVNVVLQGDAKNLFKMVKTQNDINTRVTGRNALA